MLGQEVSRLLKGTFFSKNELTIVNIESSTSQSSLSNSLITFLQKSLSEKKSITTLDLMEHAETILDSQEKDSALEEQVEIIKKIIEGVTGCEFLLIKNIDFFSEILKNSQKLLRVLIQACYKVQSLSKKCVFIYFKPKLQVKLLI